MRRPDFRKTRFVRSAAKPEDFLFDLPAVTFLGRSNVGKSSLINALVGQKNLMKTSKTPGRTQLVNYAVVDGAFYLVDVPGYGYATSVRDTFSGLMEAFLTDNRSLRKIYLLLDSRRLLQESDLPILEDLKALPYPLLVVFTKTDKLSAAEKKDLLLQEEKLLPIPSLSFSVKDAASVEKLRTDIRLSV